MLPKPLKKLIEEFERLPSIGHKTAERLAFHIIKQPIYTIERFAQAIDNVKKDITLCKECYTFTEKDKEICSICANPQRIEHCICVVAEIPDAQAIERSQYKGRYHILHGLISPMKGIGPEELRLKELIQKVETKNIQEVILALSTSIEGETTNLYIMQQLQNKNIKITRLGRGLPTGASIEWTDEKTLQDSLETRREI